MATNETDHPDYQHCSLTCYLSNMVLPMYVSSMGPNFTNIVIIEFDHQSLMCYYNH